MEANLMLDNGFYRFWLADGCFVFFIYGHSVKKMVECLMIFARLWRDELCFEDERHKRFVVMNVATVRDIRVLRGVRCAENYVR